MTVDQLIAAFALPASCRVDQRVPKKLFLENGAPSSTDKKIIQAGIDEVRWIATLKPGSIGIAAYKDESCDFSELAMLLVRFRPEAKVPRLTELLHRAIPYPLLLIAGEPASLSLSHKRLSLSDSSKVVLEGDIQQTAPLVDPLPGLHEFLTELPIARQAAPDLHALYQSWMNRIIALRAAAVTGKYTIDLPASEASIVSESLNARDELLSEISKLRAHAAKEKQLNRRVELNLNIQRLSTQLANLMPKNS